MKVLNIPRRERPRTGPFDLAILAATLRRPVESAERVIKETVHVREREERLSERMKSHRY